MNSDLLSIIDLSQKAGPALTVWFWIDFQKNLFNRMFAFVKTA